MHWLTTIRLHGMSDSRRDWSRRLLSLTASCVGMVAITNSISSLLVNSVFTIWIFACMASSFCTMLSWSSAAPKSPLTALDADASFFRRRMIFASELSRKSGRLRRRSVWPVGAVSKMMRENLAYSSLSTKSTTLAMATPSSRPGGAVVRMSPSCRSFSGPASMPKPMPLRKSDVFCCPSADSVALINAALASSTSISIAHRSRSVPSICRGWPPPMSWSKESPREWAGSVETTSTECPAPASLAARLADRLVFPTPPLPLSMMYFRSVPRASSSNTEASVPTTSAAPTT
mmetsp:Transcript_28959/g.74313  ORF Transcript_28959/g.74313 Transcript_28959/m.74313 type:complete len:290 (-) Transcript_28959:789-1658(-)